MLTSKINSILLTLLIQTCSASFESVWEVMTDAYFGISNGQFNPFTHGELFSAWNEWEDIEDYGCWCYFDGVKGHGDPVDTVDQHCKQLNLGYECIKMDHPECNVTWIEYYSDIMQVMNGDLKTEEMCSEFNEDQCAIDVCTVEVRFVEHNFVKFLEGTYGLLGENDKIFNNKWLFLFLEFFQQSRIDPTRKLTEQTSYLV